MQVRQLELEVVIARNRDHLALGVGSAYAQRRGRRPAQRPGLTAVDPIARLVYVQELRRSDLRQPDGGYVAGLLVEDLAHLLVHALRLDRHVVEVGLAQQRALALTALFQPRTAVLELAGRFPFARRLDEQAERGACVR